MANKLYKADSFEELNKYWTLKLKAHGFHDIECGEENPVILPQIFRPTSTAYFGGGSYFDYCHELLRTFKFRRTSHRFVFELHTEGKSIMNISEQLAVHPLFKPMTDVAVMNLIERIKQDYARG